MENLKNLIESIKETEEECYENMPESIQVSERGDRAQEVITNLEDAISNLEYSVDSLDTACE